jgi:hypothetical protein
MDDTTIIYYTANRVKPTLRDAVIKQLRKAAGNSPIISVSQKPMDLGHNICVGDIGQSVRNMFVQLLSGARAAETKYVATAEDDVLYPYEHYHTKHPTDGKFMYDYNRYSIFTWKPPAFCYVPMGTTISLICNRELLIEALEERFTKYQGPWEQRENGKVTVGEPGRNEGKAGLVPRDVQRFRAKKAFVYFDHEDCLCYRGLGKRKLSSRKQVDWLEGWGTAAEVLTSCGYEIVERFHAA